MPDESVSPVATRKKALRWVFILLVTLAFFPPIYSYFDPWTRICCATDEINIQTGHSRHSKYYWFIRYSREIRDTPISLAIGSTAPFEDESTWRTVNTLSPGHGNSPHYAFHGALGQAHNFEQIASLRNWNPERRREVAAQILNLWQTTSTDRAVDAYLNGIIQKELAPVPSP